eukprot:3118926-Amphidinium_carterae.4
MGKRAGIGSTSESTKIRILKAWLEGTADFTMGSLYYDSIRSMYCRRSRMENQLVYAEDDVAPPSLVKAIGKARKHPPNRGPF